MKNQYHKTIYACFLGYIVQAIVNNFVPLLFLTFEETYQIPLSRITLLVTINFAVRYWWIYWQLDSWIALDTGCRF